MSKDPDINYPLDDIRSWVIDNNEDKIINKTEFRKRFNAQGTRQFTSLYKQLKRLVDVDEEFGEIHKKKIKFEWLEEVQAKDISKYKGNTNARGTREDTLVRLYMYLILNVFNEQSLCEHIDFRKYGLDILEDYIQCLNVTVKGLSKSDGYIGIRQLGVKFFNIPYRYGADDHRREIFKRAVE